MPEAPGHKGGAGALGERQAAGVLVIVGRAGLAGLRLGGVRRWGERM